ncbi:MAG: T9SS type A sorting domain-containing protein, partial [Cytophagales bacterium]
SNTAVTVGGNNFRKTSRFSNCEICSLPLEWVSFKTERTEEGVSLSWITAKETDVSHFVVERSDDGINFVVINHFIPAQNGRLNQYRFNDKEASSSVLFYRIRQVDFDYRYSFSSIARVSESGTLELELMPNPANDRLEIKFNKQLSENVNIEVLNTSGQKIHSVDMSSQEQSHTLNLTSWTKGTYIIKTIVEGVPYFKKLVVY